MNQDKVIKTVIFSLLLVFLGSFLVHKINLPTDDLGRHIKMGEIILNDFGVPDSNLFSYTQTEYPFVNHHWLSEVVFYILYLIGGFNVLIILKVVVLLATFSVLFWLSVKRSNFFVASLFAPLIILLFVERTDVRPEIFSYLFTSLYLLIFYLYEQGKKKVLWYLVPLQLVWVNLHIYFFLGSFLIVVWILSQIDWKELWLNKVKTNQRKFLGIIGLSFVVLFLNPNFIKGAVYPLFVLGNYGYTIAENQTLTFLRDYTIGPSISYFWVVFVLLICGFVLNRKKVAWFDFVCGVFIMYAGWRMLRNLPVVAMLALPILSINFNQGFKVIIDKLRGDKRGKNVLIIIRDVIYILIILFLMLQSYVVLTGQDGFFDYKHKRIGLGLTEDSESSVKFFVDNNIDGPVFNNFDIGSYLDFYLEPGSVFVDNRPEAYPEEFWKYVVIPAQSEVDWWGVFEKYYDFNSIFFGVTDGTGWGRAFLSRIIVDKQWVVVYVDRHAIILVKDVEKNEELIEKYGMSSGEVSVELGKNMKVVAEKEEPALEEEKKRGKLFLDELIGPGVASY